MKNSHIHSPSTGRQTNEATSPRQRFDRWMAQRDLDLYFRANTALDGSVAYIVEKPQPNEFTPAFSPLPSEAGEVRLLDESFTPGHRGPVFTILIELDNDAGMGTLVSASPYQEAATPFEIKLGHPMPGIDVLQIWNLRRLPLAVLTKSWLVDHLHPDDLAVARTVARAEMKGIYPPEEVRPFCGTPIVHPLDPRRVYLEEQAGVLNHLQELGAEIHFAEETEPARVTAPQGVVIPFAQITEALDNESADKPTSTNPHFDNLEKTVDIGKSKIVPFIIMRPRREFRIAMGQESTKKEKISVEEDLGTLAMDLAGCILLVSSRDDEQSGSSRLEFEIYRKGNRWPQFPINLTWKRNHGSSPFEIVFKSQNDILKIPFTNQTENIEGEEWQVSLSLTINKGNEK